MARPSPMAVVRWALAAVAIGWALRQLRLAWATTPLPAFVGTSAQVGAAVAATVAALLGLTTVSYWGVRAAGLGRAPRLRWRWWLRVWFQSYVYRYIPGKVVLAAERARLGVGLGVPAATGVLLVVWESGLLVAGAAVFGVVGVVLRPPAEAGLVTPGVAAGGAAVALLGCLLFPLVLRALAALFPRLGTRIPGLLLDVPALAQLGLILGNAACWTLLGLSFAATARCFAGGTEADPVALVVWFVASYVLGQVSSVAPAGLGVREAVLVAALANVAPAPLVLAWSVATRLLQAAVEFTLLAASLTVTLPAPDLETPR